jgi:SHS family lactate transporter-like MFS transporter
MEAVRLFRSLTREQRNTFIACFLGWALDAFDFFLLTFVIPPMAHDFGRSVKELTYAIALTLAMRPLGAFIFGLLADKFGRRIPLMIDIIFYSVMELLTAFAPNYSILLVFRALYGIGMGGEWGLGASLAMEALPTESRGLFSGILQQGYAFGYLLAAVVYWIVYPFFGWRGLFIAGALPAGLVIFMRAHVPESPAWLRQKPAQDFWRIVLRELALPGGLLLGAVLAFAWGQYAVGTIIIAAGVVAALRLKPKHWTLFVYLILLMTAFNAMSHGTQDMYQTFLGEQRGLGVTGKSATGIIYAIGAICGGSILGHISQRLGRRRSIILAAAGGIVLIPLWVFSPTLWVLVIGGFGMQFMVQGAWGIVPVHLNELSPPDMRGTFPGFAYQLGNLFAANTAFIEAKLAEHFAGDGGHPDYAKALGIFAFTIFAVLIVVAAIGGEHRGREF